MKVGVIGAGFIGRGLAALAHRAGHEVMIANSRGPQTLSSAAIALQCQVGTAEEAAAFGEVVFLAVPYHARAALPAAALSGKIVGDANNYYPQRDGHIEELDRHQSTTSELLAGGLPGARVVKAFNAILERDLEADGKPSGTPGRRALPIAGDDAEAKRVMSLLMDQFGYDVVDAGPLSEGWRFERAMPGYCIALDRAGMAEALAAAERGVEVPLGSWRTARPASRADAEAAGYRSVFRPGMLRGQVILVTGGGSGIGRCIAHEAAALGARVVILGRTAAKLDAVVAEIVADGGRADSRVCDIRDEEGVKEVVCSIVAAHGGIDGLVNNAGGQFVAGLEGISGKGWDAVVRANLTGGFLMARECYLQSMKARGGAIVNITADYWGSMPNMGPSGASRAGMANLTGTAAAEWAHAGVRVNAVAPGYIASSGGDHYPPEVIDPMARKMVHAMPLGRFGLEAEVSAAVLFLLCPAASFISGVELRVDGGRPQMRLGWETPLPDAAAAQRPAICPYDGFHRAVEPEVVKRLGRFQEQQ